MPYTYDETRKALLAKQWATMQVARDQAGINKQAAMIVAKRALYEAAERATGVPWELIGVIDAREGGLENLGTRHLHCGDRLNDYTIHVPAGRPQVGHPPPFTWIESAIDALRYQNFDKLKDWMIEGKPNMPRWLHQLEPYNGLAYFNHGRPSPYMWSHTTIYDPPSGPGGKVLVDHGPIEDVYPTGPHKGERVIDPQVGCAPLLQAIFKLAPRQVPKTSESLPEPTPAPSNSPKNQPEPALPPATGLTALITALLQALAALLGGGRKP